jgi:flagellin
VKENDGGTEKIRFLSTLSNFKVSVGSNSSGAGGITTSQGSVQTSTAAAGGSTSDIATQENAQNAVTALADAVDKLGQAQAVVGRGQNQFGFAVNLAQSQLTNLAASESRIRDADLAQEAANLSKAQIQLQAGIAALAQLLSRC